MGEVAHLWASLILARSVGIPYKRQGLATAACGILIPPRSQRGAESEVAHKRVVT